jgi:DNA-binding NtrC family response regulator/serine/threonine protein kinase
MRAETVARAIGTSDESRNIITRVASPNLGRYRLQSRIAAGGMGEVYRGVDVGWGGIERPVAIKLIAPLFAREPDFVRTFVDEAKLSFLLCHGNVVNVRDFGQTDETYFIAMEWIDGADLGAILKRLRQRAGQPLPLRFAVLVAVEAARGLDYAHRLRDGSGRELNVVHRDVSPSNLLVSYEGEVKVSDFGIARSRMREAYSMPGALKGKIGYLAPEQARGEVVDLRADVFALGAVLYESITGRNPFTFGGTERETLERVRTGSFVPPRELVPTVPEGLEAVLLRAMAADRDARYASCGALREDLEAFARRESYAMSPSDFGRFVRELMERQPDEGTAPTPLELSAVTPSSARGRVSSAKPFDRALGDGLAALGGDGATAASAVVEPALVAAAVPPATSAPPPAKEPATVPGWRVAPPPPAGSSSELLTVPREPLPRAWVWGGALALVVGAALLLRARLPPPHRRAARPARARDGGAAGAVAVDGGARPPGRARGAGARARRRRAPVACGTSGAALRRVRCPGQRLRRRRLHAVDAGGGPAPAARAPQRAPRELGGGLAPPAARGDPDAARRRIAPLEGAAAMTHEPKTRALRPDERPLVRQAERCRLTVAAGESVEVAGTILRVGSKEGNALRIVNETVSRYHFEIEPTPLGFLLRDLGSTNGTFVDGYRVRELYLPRRAQIKAGEVALAFEALGENVPIELSPDDRFGDALGRSAAMREVFSTLEKVAPKDLTVLLEGESGTGKERLAEAIHLRSPRAKARFVVLDCASVPASLMESELLGHERGAFTGAQIRRIGRFEEAAGGTLFLDEIGELPLELQPKLLRALERREIRRVGGSSVIPVDVRVIAATNRDLVREVNRGAFREDLYYRLAVVRVRVPPLRERPEDVPLLVEHFVRDALDGDEVQAREVIAGISEANWQGLLAHSWPGNVRELRNFIERTLAVSGAVSGETPAPTPTPPATATPPPVDLTRPFIEAREALLAQFERGYLETMLERHQGNISRAARAAGLDRMHFKRLLARHRR